MSDLPGRIALIGLGNMGAPMAERWLAAGVEVHGFDMDDATVSRLRERGGVGHDSARSAAVAADICVLMLPNSEIVDRVVADLVDARVLGEGACVIDMSSSQPERTVVLGERLSELGVGIIDAPVSGGVRGVVAGNLAIMVGGLPTLVEAATPLLGVLGHVTRVGALGAGHAAKALNNLVSAAHLWVTSEAVLIAERFGIERQAMVDLLNASTGRSVSSEVKWPRFILTESFDSGFQARLLSKDAKVAAGLAATLGLPDLLGAQVAQWWETAAEQMPAGADHTEIVRWIAAAYSADGR